MDIVEQFSGIKTAKKLRGLRLQGQKRWTWERKPTRIQIQYQAWRTHRAAMVLCQTVSLFDGTPHGTLLNSRMDLNSIKLPMLCAMHMIYCSTERARNVYINRAHRTKQTHSRTCEREKQKNVIINKKCVSKRPFLFYNPLYAEWGLLTLACTLASRLNLGEGKRA